MNSDIIRVIYEYAWWYITQPWVWAVSIGSILFDIALFFFMRSFVKNSQYNGDDDDLS